MPLYAFVCEDGHQFDKYVPLAHFAEQQHCGCGKSTERLIGAPMLVTATEDVSYTSPIDGRVITSRDGHREDLKRNNCIPYDPEVKTDYARRIKDSEAHLDQVTGETVERTIHQMPSRTRAKLYAELESGATAQFARSTLGGSHG